MSGRKTRTWVAWRRYYAGSDWVGLTLRQEALGAGKTPEQCRLNTLSNWGWRELPPDVAIEPLP
jgi:hypothetical protein